MGGNPLDLDGLADDVTAPTRGLRSLYHHFTITLQSLQQASVSSVITNDSVPQRSATPTHAPLFPPVLCDDAVEILGPCRPARHTLWVIMTRLVAQHGAFAGIFVREVCRGSSQRVITWRFRAVWRVDAASPCSESPSSSPIIPSRARGRSWSCSGILESKGPTTSPRTHT